MEWKNYLCIEYEDWPFSIWEESDEMEQCPAPGFKEAYALFKEPTQRKKKERKVMEAPEVIKIDSEGVRGVLKKDFEGNQCLRNSSLAAGEKTKKKKGLRGKSSFIN